MPAPRRTQKQIAERYKGNLGYYNKLHPWRRARFWISFVAFFGGLVVVALSYKRAPEKFFNPGALSQYHAHLPNNCSDCHDKSLITDGKLSPHQFKQIVRDSFHEGVASNRVELIDKKCEDCHFKLSGRVHTFHEASVVQNRSCSACHQEHQGAAGMQLVASVQCAACHNNSATMNASSQKGMQISPAAFQNRHPLPPQQVVFDLPRPPQGFTSTFANFWENHPDFQIKRVNARDPDVLRFNHQRHFASDIPPINGQKLDCNYCHKPQPDGRFMQRITFAANCQVCHSLQFDARNPDLRLPHGDVDLVRTFLRTLSAQYADYARLKRGMRESEVGAFVAQQIKQLRDQFHSGEELERAVFFTTNPYKPQEKSGAPTRANFSGCAFCHEVKLTRNVPAITKPILVDRWMLRSTFNHAKHQVDPITQKPLDCNVCHQATQSRDTADVLMPTKANCVTCHSPQGKIAAECITCHQFHATPPTKIAANNVGDANSVKQMLLGQNR